MSDLKVVPSIAAVDAGEKPWYQGNNGATGLTRGEAQRRARELLEGKDYRDSLSRRIKMDALPAAVEQMLWYYAYGKPIEQVNLNVQHEDLSSLSIEQLQLRAARLAQELEEAQALDEAIPAEFKVA